MAHVPLGVLILPLFLAAAIGLLLLLDRVLRLEVRWREARQRRLELKRLHAERRRSCKASP